MVLRVRLVLNMVGYIECGNSVWRPSPDPSGPSNHDLIDTLQSDTPDRFWMAECGHFLCDNHDRESILLRFF